MVTIASSLPLLEYVWGSVRMSVIVLMLGILTAGAGLAAIGFGVPNNGIDLGHTLDRCRHDRADRRSHPIGLAAAVATVDARSPKAASAAQRVRPVRPTAASCRHALTTLQSRPEPVPPRAELQSYPCRISRSLHAPCCARTAARAARRRTCASSAIERLRSALPPVPTAWCRKPRRMCRCRPNCQCHSSGGRAARANGTRNAPWFRGAARPSASSGSTSCSAHGPRHHRHRRRPPHRHPRNGRTIRVHVA